MRTIIETVITKSKGKVK